MKKKLISVVALSALLVGGLSTLIACGSKPSGESNQSSQAASGALTVSYTQSSDYTINGLKDSYAAGETVTFTVTVTNPEKTISSVRVDGEKVPQNDKGEYYFVISQSTSISIRLGDAPVLTAFYSGNPMVGETLVFTTKIDFADNTEFTITAKTGANLVQINGHEVKLLSIGNVLLEIAAGELKTQVNIDIYENETGLGTNIAYTTGLTKSGGQSIAPNYPGTWVYWSGDGGNVSSFRYNTSTNQYEMSYSTGWAFYGVQFWYTLPYAQVGDTYKVRWEVESNVAGDITINNQKVTLRQGVQTLAFNVTQGSGDTIAVQMGYRINEQNEGSLEGGSSFKFKPVRIYDSDTTHTYHHVLFTLESQTLKDIYVRSGQTVAAPEVEGQEGKVFTGFFDGDTRHDPDAVVTKDSNYVARFVTKTEENTRQVTLMLGDKQIGVVDVFKGNVLTVPGGLNYGFGQKLKALYTDPALSQPFNQKTAINENITLYVKTQIAFEETYANSADIGNKFLDEWIIENADGSVTLRFNGWGSDQRWHLQANFKDSMIKGSLGERYTISFVYSMNVAGAGALVYDGNTLDSLNFEVGSKISASLTYEGGAHEGDFKLTFEFGTIAKDVPIEFTLHSIAIAKN